MTHIFCPSNTRIFSTCQDAFLPLCQSLISFKSPSDVFVFSKKLLYVNRLKFCNFRKKNKVLKTNSFATFQFFEQFMIVFGLFLTLKVWSLRKHWICFIEPWLSVKNNYITTMRVLQILQEFGVKSYKQKHNLYHGWHRWRFQY